MRRLLPLLRPAALPAALAVLLGLAAVGGGMGLQGTGAYLLDRAALHPATVLLLLVPIVGVRFFSLLRASARYGERLLAHDATLRLLSALKVRIFAALARATPPALVERSSGEWLRRLSADVDRLETLFVDAIGPGAVLLLVAALTAAVLDPLGRSLAATAVAGLLVAGVGIPLVGLARQRRRRVQLLAHEGKLARGLVESVAGMADLLMTPNGGAVRRELLAESRDAAHGRLALDRLGILLRSLTLFAGGATGLLVLVRAVPLVEDGRLPGADLAAVVLLTIAAFEAVVPQARAFATFAEDVEAARRSLSPPPPRPAPTVGPEPRGFALELRGLSFRYGDGEPWILEDVSFELTEGRHVLLVGPSGAGKSTLLYLIARLLVPQRGRLTLGGVDLSAVPEATLRRLVALVDQRPHLFHATLAQNIRLARPEATPEELLAAVEAAGLGPLAASLPKGLDTPVGEDGFQLSGGEQRRVALARAILRDAPILLLDEPWTGLDRETAAAVTRSLERLARGRTLLLVSHDPLPAFHADAVWRLADGRLELGSKGSAVDVRA